MNLETLTTVCEKGHRFHNHCFECEPVICRMCKHLVVTNEGQLDRSGSAYHFSPFACYEKFLKGHKPRETKTKISIKTCSIPHCCLKLAVHNADTLSEDHVAKKQKTEEEPTKHSRIVLDNGFYTSNFGKDSHFYKLLKEAKDRIGLIYEKHADDTEDFECKHSEMKAFEQSVPAAFVGKIGDILEIVDRDYQKIDDILAKRNKENADKQ